MTENDAEFDARQLFKRETFVEQKKDRHLVLVYQSSASGGECGLKTKNLQRMQAPPTRVILLNTSNIEHRIKRSTSGPEKMIELAVFVDEVLYASTKRKGSSDPVNAIQDIVFTYINSVSVQNGLVLRGESRAPNDKSQKRRILSLPDVRLKYIK